MKRISFISTFLLSISFTISSQVINEYGIKVGLNSAYQTSYLETRSYGSSENRLGYNIGIFASFINNNYFNLLIEPRITQKGFSENFENLGTIKPSLTYFTLSFLGKPKAKFNFITGYLLAGISANWLINKNEDIFNGIFESVKHNSVSLVAGIGVQKNIFKKNSISMEVKYDYEIQDNRIHDFQYNGNLYFFEYGQTFRNKTFEFNLGVGFR